VNTELAENLTVGLKSVEETRNGFSDWRTGLARGEDAPREELELLR